MSEGRNNRMQRAKGAQAPSYCLYATCFLALLTSCGPPKRDGQVFLVEQHALLQVTTERVRRARDSGEIQLAIQALEQRRSQLGKAISQVKAGEFSGDEFVLLDPLQQELELVNSSLTALSNIQDSSKKNNPNGPAATRGSAPAIQRHGSATLEARLHEVNEVVVRGQAIRVGDEWDRLVSILTNDDMVGEPAIRKDTGVPNSLIATRVYEVMSETYRIEVRRQQTDAPYTVSRILYARKPE